MRALLLFLLLFGSVAASRAADEGRIVKVLPFFLDQQGRDATSPSLFDRDAYQAYLREHTNEVSGVRFDVLWKAATVPDEKIKIWVELRGIGAHSIPKLKTLQVDVTPGTFRKWTSVPLTGADYKDFGAVIAWRVTLWKSGRMLNEQKSFLW